MPCNRSRPGSGPVIQEALFAKEVEEVLIVVILFSPQESFRHFSLENRGELGTDECLAQCLGVNDEACPSA